MYREVTWQQCRLLSNACFCLCKNVQTIQIGSIQRLHLPLQYTNYPIGATYINLVLAKLKILRQMMPVSPKSNLPKTPKIGQNDADLSTLISLHNMSVKFCGISRVCHDKEMAEGTSKNFSMLLIVLGESGCYRNASKAQEASPFSHGNFSRAHPVWLKFRTPICGTDFACV